jgi:methionine synthase II (cobalamin-independent)
VKGATGVGSLPGDDPREAAAWVIDMFPDFPHLAELPARGPWADLTGRGLAVADGLSGELTVSGWRLVTRAGRDAARARSVLAQDLDALEERLTGFSGPVKVQVCGPITLAATVELRSGHAAVTDVGARQDLAHALAQGVAEHLADLHRRLPDADLVLQVDEPALAICLAGELPTASGFSRVRAVPTQEAQRWIALSLAAAVDAMAGSTVVHCCDARPPVDVLVAAGAQGLSLDLTRLDERATDSTGTLVEDHLGAALESGVVLFAGAVDALGPVSDVGASVDLVRTLTARWGLSPEQVGEQVVVTPTCGLAGFLRDDVAAVCRRVVEVARRLQEEPEPSS